MNQQITAIDRALDVFKTFNMRTVIRQNTNTNFRWMIYDESTIVSRYTEGLVQVKKVLIKELDSMTSSPTSINVEGVLSKLILKLQEYQKLNSKKNPGFDFRQQDLLIFATKEYGGQDYPDVVPDGKPVGEPSGWPDGIPLDYESYKEVYYEDLKLNPVHIDKGYQHYQNTLGALISELEDILQKVHRVSNPCKIKTSLKLEELAYLFYLLNAHQNIIKGDRKDIHRFVAWWFSSTGAENPSEASVRKVFTSHSPQTKSRIKDLLMDLFNAAR